MSMFKGGEGGCMLWWVFGLWGCDVEFTVELN